MATLAVISQVLLSLAGIFLIIVVLLQRGRGGGLAGAFGGLGGQSAFGTKAGDVFTRITIVISIIWVVLAGGSGYFLRASSEQKGSVYEQNATADDGTDEDSTDATTDDDPPIRTADPIVTPPATDSAGDTDADGAAETDAASAPEGTTDGSESAPDAADPDGSSPEE